VVQYLDTQNVTSLFKSTSNILVLHTWLEIPAGMVVGYQDGCGSLPYCFSKDLRLYLLKCTIK
jgi:hypothetical protein